MRACTWSVFFVESMVTERNLVPTSRKAITWMLWTGILTPTPVIRPEIAEQFDSWMLFKGKDREEGNRA